MPLDYSCPSPMLPEMLGQGMMRVGSDGLTLYLPNGDVFARKCAKPTISPASTGAPIAAVTITLACVTAGALLYYTTDGSMPTVDSTLYSVPFNLPAPGGTVTVLGIRPGYLDSDTKAETYVVNGAVATPTFSPVAGGYGPTQSVTISCATSGAAIYYTTNGDTPTVDSTPYTVPVSVTSSKTLKAIAVKALFTDSAIGSAAYTINGACAAPTFDPVAGAVADDTPVTLATATAGAAIHYTVDGSTPTIASPTYTVPIVVTDPVTIKAIATKTAFSNSTVATAAYTIAP